MAPYPAMTVDEVLQLLGYLLRVFGAFVFGAGIGWLAIQAYKDENRDWKLAIAGILGILGAFVLTARWVGGGGTIGGLALGIGLGILIWGPLAGFRSKS
jgi:hypothetical protein